MYGNAFSAAMSRRVGEVIGAFGEVAIGGECLSPPSGYASLEMRVTPPGTASGEMLAGDESMGSKL